MVRDGRTRAPEGGLEDTKFESAFNEVKLQKESLL